MRLIIIVLVGVERPELLVPYHGGGGIQRIEFRNLHEDSICPFCVTGIERYARTGSFSRFRREQCRAQEAVELTGFLLHPHPDIDKRDFESSEHIDDLRAGFSAWHGMGTSSLRIWF